MIKRFFLFIITTIMSLFAINPFNSIANNSLVEVTYSPGYSDMIGEAHTTKLCQDERGNWIIECSDRESHEVPMIVTTYAVHPDAVNHFEEYLKKNNVAALSYRSESDDFITDYSPWSMSIVFEDESGDRAKRKRYKLGEYHNYSKRDMRLINDIKTRLFDLRGEKLSERIEAD